MQERQGIRLDHRKVSSGAGAHRRSEGPGTERTLSLEFWSNGMVGVCSAAVPQMRRGDSVPPVAWRAAAAYTAPLWT